MYYDSQGKGHLFQPIVFDKNTFWHFGLSLVGFIAIYAIMCFIFKLFAADIFQEYPQLYDVLMMLSMLFINCIGFSYEYGQATGYKSQEGIDQLDLMANMIGSVFGIIIVSL